MNYWILLVSILVLIGSGWGVRWGPDNYSLGGGASILSLPPWRRPCLKVNEAPQLSKLREEVSTQIQTTIVNGACPAAYKGGGEPPPLFLHVGLTRTEEQKSKLQTQSQITDADFWCEKEISAAVQNSKSSMIESDVDW